MKRDEFRRLEEGEVVLPTDECLHESGEWRPAQGYIGKPAPDPKYTAHCQFRRRETEGAELRPDPKAEILTRLDEHLSKTGHEFQPMYCAFCYSYQQTFWKISPKSDDGFYQSTDITTDDLKALVERLESGEEFGGGK